MPANASAEFQRAVAQLEAAVRGENLEPPPPRVIPMREYYEESEREQNELITFQREQLERLERAGLIRQASSAQNAQQSSPTGGLQRSSRAGGAAQRSMSFAGMFLKGMTGRRGTGDGGGGGRSGSISSTSGGVTPSHRRTSMANDGSPLGRGAASPSLLVRKQSSLGVGMLVQSGGVSGPYSHDGAESVDSHQSSFAGTPLPSSANMKEGDGAAFAKGSGHSHSHGQHTRPSANSNVGTSSSTPGKGAAATGGTAAAGGAIAVTKVLQDLLRRDANGRPILLKPIYNPYRSSEREEAAQMHKRLRPHTLQLLQPLTFEKAAEVLDPTHHLQKNRHALSLHNQQQQEMESSRQPSPRRSAGALAVVGGSTAVSDVTANSHSCLKGRMEFWRSHEADQLEVFSRAAAAAVSAERQQWEHVNRRERGILAKVDKVQKNAEAIQAARTHERQRLDDMKVESQCRVQLECLENAEDAFRNRYVATEVLLWGELLNKMAALSE